MEDQSNHLNSTKIGRQLAGLWTVVDAIGQEWNIFWEWSLVVGMQCIAAGAPHGVLADGWHQCK
jgi:hypothetical protein